MRSAGNRRVGPEQVVAGVRVWCRPRGAALRDVTDPDGVRWVHWFTAVPGVVSLVGLVLHHTIYRRQWEVLAVPTSPSVPARCLVAGSQGDAEAWVAELVAWLRSGHSLAEFRND
ncbi:hypothetical protein GCM10009668_21980 [Nocardioides dubius]|uniref:Uncharacterized protein n=1 Tax=Nocardioides dubius TaxID=317019 RepID=A0ABN1TWG8_9ACTN